MKPRIDWHRAITWTAAIAFCVLFWASILTALWEAHR